MTDLLYYLDLQHKADALNRRDLVNYYQILVISAARSVLINAANYVGLPAANAVVTLVALASEVGE